MGWSREAQSEYRSHIPKSNTGCCVLYKVWLSMIPTLNQSGLGGTGATFFWLRSGGTCPQPPPPPWIRAWVGGCNLFVYLSWTVWRSVNHGIFSCGGRYNHYREVRGRPDSLRSSVTPWILKSYLLCGFSSVCGASTRVHGNFKSNSLWAQGVGHDSV